ncbi:MAG: PTS transporter subunit EIIC [Selenomonadaceae bacterium]|nr:PTS transporter subunit EIIC [Selenomonadaceae bacterium]
MTNEQLAEKIYRLAGPSDNILRISNCMTRLRLQLAKKNDAMLNGIKGLDGVMGINDTEEELQIILGPGKATAVAELFKRLAEDSPKAASPASGGKPQIGDGKALHARIRARNATPVKLFFKRIASIFIPLIPGFIACGLLTGCLAIAAKIDPALTASPLWNLLATAGNAVFWGMNLFVGYNASREFGGTPIIGGLLGAFISHPGLSSITFGETHLLSGRGGVIAVILVAAFAAWLEKRLHRIIPEMFDLFLTPFCTVVLSACMAAFLLQPLGGLLSDAIGAAATGAISSGGAITGFLLGGIWLPLVMFGVHQSFTPIHADLLANFGVTILLPILAMAGAGQIGASLAVYFKTRNSFLKKTILSALPVGLMGVGEPLIYGVTFPLGKPFIGACIGGAFGGAVEAAFMVGARAMGISGLPLAPTTDNIPIYLLGLVTAYITGFIATWLLGFDDPPEDGSSVHAPEIH